jgi:PAS domain S-box-containing protein
MDKFDSDIPEKASILVVDDTPANLRLLVKTLNKQGYRVRTAASGDIALSTAQAEPPDLILLDILMSGMDGYEVCRRLKADKRTRDIPVIFVSSIDQILDKVKAFSVGGVDYIARPFQAKEVLVRVKNHLTTHQLQKKLLEQNRYLKEENKRRKRIQELLKESRTRYRLLAENATDMISTQTMDNVYRYVSPACRTLLGYKIEEMIGHTVYEFIHPDDVEAAQASFNLRRDGPTVSTITYRAGHKNGHYVWLETLSKLAREPGTNYTEIVSVSRDITERKQMEEALRSRNQELDAFAHTVAHDLKSPLTNIIGYAEFLCSFSQKIPEEEVWDMVQRIGLNGRKMVDIIESLLLLAGVRKKQVEMKPLDMAEIIAQVQHRLKSGIEEGQGEIIQPEVWPVAAGYAPWVEEVWANYISNGLKYGGRPPCLELGAKPEADGMIRFWVKDNGLGLTSEQQSNLFTEFVRLSELRVEGYGLGLSIVQRIVRKLGGQVGVESEVGQGSIFYFTLPRADD